MANSLASPNGDELPRFSKKDELPNFTHGDNPLASPKVRELIKFTQGK